MSAAQPGFLERNYFLLRRLHSLTGIVPVGVFLINHLLTNSTAALGFTRENGDLVGGAKFDEHVHWIHSLPFLIFVEFGLILLPLAYHAAFGVVIALTAKSNVRHYTYADNWRYTLQRVSGWIALLFIVVHLGHFRFVHFLGGEKYLGTNAPFDLLQAGFKESILPLGLWMVIYLVGLAASVFHFANGIATFCITWGVTVNDSSRKKVALASGGLGLLLFIWGAMSLWAIAAINPRTTRDVTQVEGVPGTPVSESAESPARSTVGG